jgi:hypothetical protein
MPFVDVVGVNTAVDQSVFTPSPTVPSFQIFLSDPTAPLQFPSTYAVDYSNWFSVMASVSSLYHRTGAPFELGQVLQMQMGKGENFDQTKTHLIFGWAFDEETNELINIDDATGNMLTSKVDLVTALTSGLVPPDVMYRLQKAGCIGPLTDLSNLSYTVENWGSFSERVSSKASRFGLKSIGGVLKYGLLAILVLVILLILAIGAIYLIMRLFGIGTNVEITPSPLDPNDPNYPTCQYAKMPDGSVYHTINNKGDQEKVAEAPFVSAGTGILYAGVGLGLLLLLGGIGITVSKRKPAQKIEYPAPQYGRPSGSAA